MARFDVEHYDTLDPLSIFSIWLSSDFREEHRGLKRRIHAKELEDESINPWHATCYLDYMFIWLAEANGALCCPTFEDWLLAVIRFADDLSTRRDTYGIGGRPGDHLGILGSLPEGGKEMGLLDWGAISLDKEAHAAWVETPGSLEAIDAPPGEEGMRHPALDRNVYERCRANALDRRQQFLMELETEKLLQALTKEN